MSGEDEAISTYAQFRDEVLPRIKAQGYTAIQLMAIQVWLGVWGGHGGGWGGEGKCTSRYQGYIAVQLMCRFF